MRSIGLVLGVIGITLQMATIGIALAPMDLFQGAYYENTDLWELEDWDPTPDTERISIIGYWHPDMPPSNVAPTSIELIVKPLSFRDGAPPGWAHIRVSMSCRTYDIPEDGNRDGYFSGRVEMVEFKTIYHEVVTVPLTNTYGHNAANWASCSISVDFDAPGPGGPNAAQLGWGYEYYREYFLRLNGEQYAGGEEPAPAPDPTPGPDPGPYPEPPVIDPADEGLTPPSPPAAVDWRIIAVLAVVGLVMLVMGVVIVRVI